MKQSVTYKVEITGLKYKRPFFKVFARQIDRKFTNSELKSHFCNGSGFARALHVGNICVARLDNETFERCRIINIDLFEDRATVHLIDCGVNAKLPIRKVSRITLNMINIFHLINSFSSASWTT